MNEKEIPTYNLFIYIKFITCDKTLAIASSKINGARTESFIHTVDTGSTVFASGKIKLMHLIHNFTR